MSTPAAFDVAELSTLVGVSRSSIYLELEATGEILGVKALRIRNRWVIPRRPIEAKLGLLESRSEAAS